MDDILIMFILCHYRYGNQICQAQAHCSQSIAKEWVKERSIGVGSCIRRNHDQLSH